MFMDWVSVDDEELYAHDRDPVSKNVELSDCNFKDRKESVKLLTC